VFVCDFLAPVSSKGFTYVKLNLLRKKPPLPHSAKPTPKRRPESLFYELFS